MNKFFNTALGSYVKIFLSAVIAVYMAELSVGHDLFSMDIVMLKKLASAGVASVLPVLYNAMNPNDTRYGNKKKPLENFKPERN